MTTGIRNCNAPLVCTALACATASSATAQDEAIAPATGPAWGFLDALGYGGLGFGLGVMVGAGMPSDNFGPSGTALGVIAGSTIAGVVGGAMIGGRARRALSRDQVISPGHRAAVAGGVVLAGATLGAVAAIPLISSEGEGTPLGSDEQTFSLLAGGGAALGASYLLAQWHHLGNRVSAAPIIREPGQYGLVLRVRL